MVGKDLRPRGARGAGQSRRAFDVREQHRHDAVARPRAVVRGATRERRVVAQDRLLHLSQLQRRLETQLLVQAPPALLVGLERIGLPAAAVEGQHQQSDQPLARRMLGRQLLELTDDEGVLTLLQARLDAVLERGGAELLQPSDLPLGERLEPDVREGWTAPERERVVERAARGRRIASACSRPRLAEQRFEPARVDRVLCDGKAVAGSHGLHCRAAGAQAPAQPRHGHLEAAHRIRR